MKVISLIFAAVLIYILAFQNKISRKPAALFKGTVFRLAADNEVDDSLQIGRCSGSFLKSFDESLYVMTSKHCFPTIDSCNDTKVRLHRPVSLSEPPIDGRCKQVIIDDREHDLIIVRVELFKDNIAYEPKEDLKYCLDGEIASVGTPLKMVHFPVVGEPLVDRSAKTVEAVVDANDIVDRSARVSENCKVTSAPVWCRGCEEKQTVQWFNCATFSGSSGAGVVNQKTNCITGVPCAADFKDYVYPETGKGAAIAVVPIFVKKYAKRLQELQIQIGPNENNQ